MSLGILDVSHTSDDDSLGKPGPLPEMKPLGRAESFFRWLLFIPCALIAFVAAYYTVTTMGLAGWEKLFHHPASYPNKSSTFHLLYHSLAAGLAGFMGVSLGALAAPAHRGVAGLVLLALLGLGVLVCAVAVGSGDSHQLIWILSGGVTGVWGGGYALRGLVRVFGWKGLPRVPAEAYWRERPSK